MLKPLLSVPPPASQYPRMLDGTLVSSTRVAFPAIPGVQSPHRIEGGRDGSTRLPFLVSQVDADGNERGGIRHPDVSVPLATYTGWNPHIVERSGEQWDLIVGR